MKLTEITDTDPMRATINRGLMVDFINRDLIYRASCDVRRSVVLYDADRMFVHAIDMTRAEFADQLATNDVLTDQLIGAGVKFWSIGVK